MNINKLIHAQELFYSFYPQGFDSPEMIKIGKKHRMDKLTAFAQESFKKSAFKNIEETIENMIKMVSRSTMVSLFEKPKFRDAVRNMIKQDKKKLVLSLKELLHGDEENGFNQMLDILTVYKLAKWTLITVFRCYYYPQTDLLFKPTTVKNIINYFELEGLVYKPRPSYEFFIKYRDTINEMKKHVNPNFYKSNAHFSGFLMMAMEL